MRVGLNKGLIWPTKVEECAGMRSRGGFSQIAVGSIVQVGPLDVELMWVVH